MWKSNKWLFWGFLLVLLVPLSLDASSKKDEKLYKLIRQGNYKKAEKFCKKQQGAFRQQCYRILAGAQFGAQIENWVLQGEDKKAEQLCQKLKGLMQTECLRILGDAYLGNQKLDRAVQYYEKSNDLNGMNRVGYRYLKKGEYEKAGRYFKKGAVSSKRARWYGQLADVYKTNGQLDIAKQYYTLGIIDYETLLKDIDYQWNQQDCQERLRLIKEKQTLPQSPKEHQEQLRLKQLLKNSALYCKKLEKSAFHFFCREEVSQRLYYIDNFLGVHHKKREMSRRFTYHYQVIRDKEKIDEYRKPLRIDNIPFRHAQSRIKPILFNHHFLIFGPISLLGEQWQPYYTYHISREEIKDEEKIAIIEVLPLHIRKPPLHFGNVMVKIADGSVVGIEWNPKSIGNFQFLLEQDKSLGISTRIVFFLELNVVKKNLHFPSKCRIKWNLENIDGTLKKNAGKSEFTVTGVDTDIQYKDYQFFSVKTEVIDLEAR